MVSYVKFPRYVSYLAIRKPTVIFLNALLVSKRLFAKDSNSF